MSSESTASAGGYYPGIGAMAFWLLAAVSTLLFAADLAEGLRQFAAYALLGLIIVTVLIGMPAVGVLMTPSTAHGICAVWSISLAGVALLGLFLARIEPPEAGGRAAQLRASLANLEPAERRLWRETDGCANPSARTRAACADLVSRREATTFELTELEARRLGSAYLWRLMLLGFILTGIVGTALRFRRDAIATVGGGDASYAPAAYEAEPVEYTPGEIAEWWFFHRVRVDPQGRLKASDAFADYCAACASAGYPAMSNSAFYTWLVAKADPSARIKSNGRMIYEGWRLVAPGELDQPAAPSEPEARPAAPNSDPNLMTVLHPCDAGGWRGGDHQSSRCDRRGDRRSARSRGGGRPAHHRPRCWQLGHVFHQPRRLRASEETLTCPWPSSR
jgi:hypothetical protein